MTTPEIKNILKNMKIFEGMTDAQLSEIIPLLKQINCPPDTQIINEGDPGESMYIISSGTVKITRSQDDDDEEIFIGLIKTGSYFGEFSLIDSLPRSANVVSLEESGLFELDKSSFDSLLQNNSDIAAVFYHNCLKETFARLRNSLANITFSQHTLRKKSEQLEEINRDLSVAQEIQNIFVNSAALDSSQRIHPRIKHHSVYYPCIEVGGDLINILKVKDDAVAVFIADVEGHGVTAALATGILRSAFHQLAHQIGDKPAELMTRLNHHFCEVLSRKLFATAYYVFIDFAAEKILVSKAGHYHPLFWQEKIEDFKSIECSGPGLGIIDDAVYNQNEYSFEKGDKLIFFTDGILEQCNNEQSMYSQKRLKDKAGELINSGRENILNELYSDALRFSEGADIDDDITMLMVEFE